MINHQINKLISLKELVLTIPRSNSIDSVESYKMHRTINEENDSENERTLVVKRINIKFQDKEC